MSPQPQPTPEKPPRINPVVKRFTLMLGSIALLAVLGWLIQTYL